MSCVEKVKENVNYPMPKGRGFLLQRRATQRH
jgi:hypothetical protein